MGKEFKPFTVEDFGLTPKDMEILVRGSQIFAGPGQAEPQEPAEPAEPEESDNADRSIP